jgi:hypothetical protein
MKTKTSTDLINGIEIAHNDLITILSCADGVSKHLSDYYNDKELLNDMIILQNKIDLKFNQNSYNDDNLLQDSKSQNVIDKKKCENCGSNNISNDKCNTCLDCSFSRCL